MVILGSFTRKMSSETKSTVVVRFKDDFEQADTLDSNKESLKVPPVFPVAKNFSRQSSYSVHYKGTTFWKTLDRIPFFFDFADC